MWLENNKIDVITIIRSGLLQREPYKNNNDMDDYNGNANDMERKSEIIEKEHKITIFPVDE